jgi:hypothetical protein
VYHVELRHFPHNLCRFNLTAGELRAIAEPWAHGQWIELGERKWSPHQAKLTVLEGERLPPERLTMGRGWRAAQRECEDVTARVLAAAGEPAAAGDAEGAASHAGQAAPGASARQDAPADSRLASDSLGLELLAALGSEALALSRAWRLAEVRFSGRPASECLSLAERAVRSLLGAGLLVLVFVSDAEDVPNAGDAPARAGERTLDEHEIEPALRALENWTAGEGSAGVRMRRA